MKRATLLLSLACGCSPATPRAPEPVVIPATPIQELPRPVAATATGDADASAPVATGGDPSPAEGALVEWSRATQCKDFDYFPDGGLRSFWCHRPKRVTLAAIKALAGVDIFASGPHKNDDLALDDGEDFGHYDPRFVRWLVDKAAPTPRDAAARAATQAAYDEKLKPLAEVFWTTLAKAKADPSCFDKEKKAYADVIAKKKVPRGYYERWFYFMNPYFCGRPFKTNDSFYFENGFDAGVNGNVTKTVVGFWLRRAMDGTMDGFAEGLKKLVEAYDPKLASTPFEPPDPNALTKAIDEGVRTANRCRKDPRAPLATAHLDIVVAADGSMKADMATIAARSSPMVPCIEAAFAAQHVPPFKGAPLKFDRPIALK